MRIHSLRRILLKEATWIGVAIIITMIICLLLVQFGEITRKVLGVNFHDTYLILGYYMALFLLWPVLFVILLIRVIMGKFKTISTNLLLIGTSLVLLLITSIVGEYLKKLFSVNEGWTVYPPLSGAKQTPVNLEADPIFNAKTGLILFFLVIILITATFTVITIRNGQFKQRR